MARDGTTVLATRDMYVYRAPFAASNAFPADTVDFGAVASPFVDLGYTDGGITFDVSVDRAEITVDQVLEPILRPVTGRSMTFSTSLAEATVSALNYAASAAVDGIDTTAAQVGTEGSDALSFDTLITDQFASWLFEALQQNGEPFRGAIWRGITTGSPSATFGVADQKAMFDLEISALIDTSSTPDRIAEFRNVIPALPAP
jgi:hypothetical protein